MNDIPGREADRRRDQLPDFERDDDVDTESGAGLTRSAGTAETREPRPDADPAGQSARDRLDEPANREERLVPAPAGVIVAEPADEGSGPPADDEHPG